jgi:hypothetical protein
MLATEYTAERVAMDEEDPEFLTATDGEESPKKWTTPWKIGGTLLGVACLTLAAAAYVVTGQQSEAARPNSARALLESAEMAETMKDNYIKFVPSLKNEDRRLRDKIQSGMQKITAHIQNTEPQVFEQLSLFDLSPEQKTNVLKVVGNMGDNRLQGIGKEVARLAKDSKSEDELKRKLSQGFAQNKSKLSKLRNEVLAPLRKLVDEDLDMTFDTDRMRLFRNSKDSWNVEVSMDKPSSRRLLDSWGTSTGSSGTDVSSTSPGTMLTSSSFDGMGTKFEEGLGVLCGMLEQARVALDQIDFVGESFDVDMKIPYWAKSLIGGLDFVTELSDCVMRGSTNEVKLMMCPMKYASAATDFLESVDNVLGINNGHFFGATTAPPGYNPAYAQTGYAPAPAPAPGYVPQNSGGVWGR